jgi:hypothetical protein
MGISNVRVRPSFSQASGIQISELLMPVAQVCGAVIAAGLLMATYGLDLKTYLPYIAP